VTETQPVQRLIAGRYRLASEIGRGSMGTVWRAYDEFLRRPVAVKEVLLPPGIPKHEADELRERTMREARAIAVLSHPNVVTLHDIAQEGGNPFVVMEYVHGSSLAHLLNVHGPLDDTQAAAVTDAVAAALQAAHQAGITHRDVKPANVLVAEDGRIKLADFGIARNISEHTLTSTGITLGSPAYIAPEVASGGAVTPAADLWGLGATLFAAVEGRAPYDPEGDVIATLLQVVNGEVPKPESTGPMAELITSLMVKDTAARMSLAEVRRRIYPFLPEPGTSAFTFEAIAKAEELAAEQPTRITASAPRSMSNDEGTPAAPPLASDPGPLPFALTTPIATPKRTMPRVLIYLAAAILFVGAGAGGFALTRKAAGQSLLPQAQVVTSEPTVVVPPKPSKDIKLVPRTGDASPDKGLKGGGYSIPVPEGWVTFIEDRKANPQSTRVRYVSEDGRYQLVVERLVGHYQQAKRTIGSYRKDLEATWPAAGDYTLVAIEPLPVQTTPEQAMQLTYRTVDGGLRRTTFANLLPADSDLWVVSLSVPTVEEDTGKKALFNPISKSFART
jgi:serine/threonine protein kinase